MYYCSPPIYHLTVQTSLAWIATTAIECIFAGTILQGLIVLDHPDYAPTQWQGTLLAWMVILVCIFVNAVLPGLLPRFEIFIIFFHIGGFIAIVVTLWIMAPIGSATFVFTTSFNEGGWPTQGLSYCVGFLGNVATFVGADASVHLAEEVANAAINIPRAIICSMCLNGAVGFTMMLTTLFCLGDADSVLGTAFEYPFIQIFYNAVQNVAGATVMGAVVLALTWSCAIGITTTASRMTWSFARDRGTPFAGFLGKVAKHNQVPINAILTVCGFAMLLQCIYFGSSVVFNDVVSLTITGFYTSYLIPASMLLYHRIRGDIMPYRSNANDLEGENIDPEEHPDISNSDPTNETKKEHPTDESPSPSPPQPRMRGVSIAQAALIWGPFHLPRILGIINNAYACTYMVFVIFWSVWPPATPVDAESMNYSIVVTSGVILFAVVWYWIRGRKEYKGPTVDEEVEGGMRRGSVRSI